MDMCPNDDGDICIKVNFPNNNTDRLILTRVPGTSLVYEGFLELESDVPAVMVNLPESNRQMVNYFMINNVYDDSERITVNMQFFIGKGQF